MSAVRVPILMYHQVDAIPPKQRLDEQGQTRPGYRGLIVSPGSFSRQMWLLKILGYRGVNMSEVMQYLRGEKTAVAHGKVVGITFDDGYQNNLIHAQPILARHGFSSTCYAVSDMAGETNSWDAEKGIGAKPLMTGKELKAWIAGGQEIGSHTQHHVNLKNSDPVVAQAEIAQSKIQLEGLTGVACKHFCYPYGYYNESHLAMVHAAGYESATTVVGECAVPADSPFELPRFSVVKNTTLFRLWRELQKSPPPHY
jgi:peptidoglycan/xylan/chitin deacetylase (PgdA/CDA1 family)